MNVDSSVAQQKDIGIAFREIADLRGDFKELRVSIIGIDGNNGLRGELREFMSQFGGRMTEQDVILRQISDAQSETEHWKKESQARFETYLEYERKATCHGQKSLDNYLETIQANNTAVKTQTIAMVASIIGALIVSASSVIIALLK